ncbi:MAG TPA: hypothetical protein VEG30_05180 [Terriglobales bacterium]|nr:hypothetical protein [Terriglobales bacterium]
MRKWYVPVTLLGIGGLGALFLTERGQRFLNWLGQEVPSTPQELLGWNESAQEQLERIQATLDRMAESMQLAMR